MPEPVTSDASVSQEKSELPTVFQMDLQKREEFLSQIGSFTQEQRRIFHRICDFYDPSLDYNRFVLHAGKDILFANNQIEILMKKIRNAHYGLLKFKLLEGELKPDKIIISNRDSKEYYANLIDDEIQRILLDEGRSFLSLDEMEEQNQRVPFDLVESITTESLSPRSIKENRDESIIYSLQLKSGGSILTTAGSMEFVIQLSRNRITSYLKNSSFMTIVSRFMDMKISDIQKKHNSKDRRFWLNLSTKVLQNREDLQLRLKHLEPVLFHSCEILHHFFKNAVREEEKEREENAARDSAMNEVCMEILKKEDFLVSPEELMRILDPYEKKWTGFKDHFYDSAVKVNNKIGLPLILCIDDKYIHRDHVYPYFRSEIAIQSKELKFHYIQLMERMLRTGNRDKITVFYTRDTFKDDVNEMIKKESPVLAEFLNKPRIISEGIVHYFKNLKKVRDVNKIKDFMNNFFDKGVIRFKDSDYLLNLYLLEIFDEAYKFLSWWKKLVLKISGKKESFKNQYSGLDEQRESIVPTQNPKRNSLKNLPGANPLKETYRKKDKSRNAPAARRRTPSVSQKQYSSRQKEKAWLEFEDAFNRKK